MDKESVKRAEVIFVGEIVDVIEKRNKKVLWFDHGHDGMEYHLKVAHAFKGVREGEIVVVFSDLSSVGIHASVGEKWLMVPRHNDDKGWTTDICSHSGKLSEKRTKKDVRFLKRQF